jgi:hypothetical protein
MQRTGVFHKTYFIADSVQNDLRPDHGEVIFHFAHQKRKIEAGRELEEPSAPAVKLTGTDAFA